jgi:hypothetical protein
MVTKQMVTKQRFHQILHLVYLATLLSMAVMLIVINSTGVINLVTGLFEVKFLMLVKVAKNLMETVYCQYCYWGESMSLTIWLTKVVFRQFMLLINPLRMVIIMAKLIRKLNHYYLFRGQELKASKFKITIGKLDLVVSIRKGLSMEQLKLKVVNKTTVAHYLFKVRKLNFPITQK